MKLSNVKRCELGCVIIIFVVKIDKLQEYFTALRLAGGQTIGAIPRGKAGGCPYSLFAE